MREQQLKYHRTDTNDSARQVTTRDDSRLAFRASGGSDDVSAMSRHAADQESLQGRHTALRANAAVQRFTSGPLASEAALT